MSLNFINKLVTHNKFWAVTSFVIIFLYLSPLFTYNGSFYVPIFDNLDSNVIWYKILSQSGMIFAKNNAIIPNMMSGLPRLSYPGEFNLILWLYYFFEAKTAFIINEVIIHLVAFISMFIFLRRYVVQNKKYYNNFPIYLGALYFALIPYWSGAGLSIAILPLVTYSLLNIKNNIAKKRDWLFIFLLPLYTSFIFIYLFYILMAGIYLLTISIRNRHIHLPLFLAITLMGIVFLLSEYRLVYAMFADSDFISHRTSFNVFFTNSFVEVHRKALTFFINGHTSHVRGLQVFYILPVILISMLLLLSKRRFSVKESMLLWLVILLSFITQIWAQLLSNQYTFIFLILGTFYLLYKTNGNKTFLLLILLQIFLSILSASFHYSGLSILSDMFPILLKLNFTRVGFVQPLIWSILFVISLTIFMRKLHYSMIFFFIILVLQINISFQLSFYQSSPVPRYSSFQDYYATNLFTKVKDSIPEKINDIKVVSYGIEPAVSLFNNFHTIDGYSPNYALSYKYSFRKVIKKYLDKPKNKEARHIYDDWGGKVYILSTTVTPQFYQKGNLVQNPQFSVKALCNLNTDYLISSNELNTTTKSNLVLKNTFIGENDSWDIYLYKIKCL